MATIKHLNLVMSASAIVLEDALTRVSAKLRGLKDTAASAFGSISGGFGGLVPGLAGALSVAGIAMEIKRGIDGILEMRHASEALGISLNQVAGIKLAVTEEGGNWEAVQTGISRYVKAVGEAKVGTEGASKAFDMLGMSAKDLSQLPTEKQLGLIGDKLMGIKDPAERAYVASLLFGRGWSEMMPILEQGSAGLDRAGEAAGRFGEVTEESVRRALEAKRDMAELSAGWESATRKLGENAGQLAFWLRLGLNYMTMTREEAKKFSEEEFAKREKALVPTNLVDTEAIKEQQKLLNEVTALENRLRSEMDTAKGSIHVVEDFMNAHKNLSPAILETAKALEAKLNAQKQDDELTKQAKGIIEQSLSTYDRYMEKLDQINMLHDAGKLSADQYAAAIGKIGDEILRNQKIETESKPPALLEAGTAGAFSAINRWVQEQGKKDDSPDTLKRIESELKALKTEAAKSAAENKRTADGIGKLKAF